MTSAKQQLFAFAGRSGTGKSTVIKRLFPSVLVVDALQFVYPLREAHFAGNHVPPEKTQAGYKRMYEVLATLDEPLVVLEVGTSEPELNVAELEKLQDKCSITVFLCVVSRETSDMRARVRGLREFSEEAHLARLARDFPNIYLVPLKESTLSYELIDMEQPLEETLPIFSQLTGRAIGDGKATPRYLGLIISSENKSATATITLHDRTLSGEYPARVELDGETYRAKLFANRDANTIDIYISDFVGTPKEKTLTVEVMETS